MQGKSWCLKERGVHLYIQENSSNTAFHYYWIITEMGRNFEWLWNSQIASCDLFVHTEKRYLVYSTAKVPKERSVAAFL